MASMRLGWPSLLEFCRNRIARTAELGQHPGATVSKPMRAAIWMRGSPSALQRIEIRGE
jgi:hypothetical protein